MAWHGMVWYGMVWYGMACACTCTWHDTVRYGNILLKSQPVIQKKNTVQTNLPTINWTTLCVMKYDAL